ncbi:MAG TPA: hypothetical protein DCF89_10355 [Flavobacteriales bacterium]|nr:hypothetical protein [Flavobacteriales bacterium]|tara:strand:+ start:1914 stop:2522 length:609 start_codon:yes stop_codon:yes gene_type:complete
MAGQLKIGGNVIATHAGTEGAGTVTLDSSTLTIGSNTTISGANIASATFPAGHIVQTVHQKYNQTTQQTSYTTIATHIETEINITAGNKVFFNYTIPTRLFASGYNYGQFLMYLYHKTGTGGTYANIAGSDKNQANYYFDEVGTLPTDYYRYFTVPITGFHTPSSGTQQFYRIYVKHIQGNDTTVGIGASNDTFVTLQEIQL